MSQSQQRADTETENETLSVLPVKIESQNIKQNTQKITGYWILEITAWLINTTNNFTKELISPLLSLRQHRHTHENKVIK